MTRKLRYLYSLVTLIVCCLFPACLEDPDMTEGDVNGKRRPSIKMNSYPDSIADGSVALSAEITSMGKGNVLVRTGFCFGYNSSELTDTLLTSAPVNSIFSITIDSIFGDSLIYWQAFAENELGIEFSEIRNTQTPSVWEAKEGINATGRNRGTIFRIGNQLCLACGELNGSTPTALKDLWIFNLTTNRWRQYADFPGSVRRFPISFVINDIAYVGTGQHTATSIFNDFYKYDVQLNRWEKIPDETTLTERYNATGIAIHGKGYLIGGRTFSASLLNDCWQFDPVSESWAKLNNFPERIAEGIAVSDGKNIYAGFGYNEDARRKLWKYDHEQDSWELFTELPEEIDQELTNGTFIKDCFYFIDYTNIIWKFNPETLIWEKKNQFPPDLITSHGDQIMHEYNNSILIGLNYCEYFYEYRPLWDNQPVEFDE